MAFTLIPICDLEMLKTITSCASDRASRPSTEKMCCYMCDSHIFSSHDQTHGE